jgi:hypothetical protein
MFSQVRIAQVLCEAFQIEMGEACAGIFVHVNIYLFMYTRVHAFC